MGRTARAEGRTRTLRAVAAAALIAAAFAAAWTLSSVGVAEANDDLGFPPSSSDTLFSQLFDGSDPAFTAGHAAAMDAVARAKTDRASASSQQAREDSRDAYADLSPAESRDLAQEQFPPLAADTQGAPVVLPNGLQLDEPLGETTATVETALGKPAGVVESTLPLATDASPDASIVDLSLVRDADGFHADRPAVDVQYPAVAQQATTLADSGVSFQPADATDVAAVNDGGNLYYADAAGTDTDYILKPQAAGVEAFWQLRSIESPETLRLQFTLPVGATLAQAPGGSNAPITVKGADGSPLATVDPPTAIDADGAAVNLDLSMDGSEVVLAVHHRDADVAYPVLVDPQVVEWWDRANSFTPTATIGRCGDLNAHNSGAGAWSYAQNTAGGQYGFWSICDERQMGWGYGLYVQQGDGLYYPNGATGFWYWGAPPDTYISSVYWAGLNHHPGNNVAGNTSNYAGIAAGGPTAWNTYFEWGNQAHWDYQQWINASNHANAQYAITGLRMNGNGVRSWAYSAVEGAWVYLNDDFSPTAMLLRHTPTLTGPNLNEGPWIDPATTNPTYQLRLADRGLGIYDYSVVRNSDGAAVDGPVAVGCTGAHLNPCPHTKDTPVESYNVNALPNGVVPVHGVVHDVNGRVGYTPTWNLRIDRVRPNNRISGPLWVADGQTVGDGPLDLYDTTLDGDASSNATAESGVKRVQLTVDGAIVYDSGDLACAPGSCSYGFLYSLTPSAFGWSPGTHNLQLIARDQLGHQSTNAWSVNYYPTSFSYGGADHSVNSPDEVDAVQDAAAGSPETETTLENGLTLSDWTLVFDSDPATDSGGDPAPDDGLFGDGEGETAGTADASSVPPRDPPSPPCGRDRREVIPGLNTFRVKFSKEGTDASGHRFYQYHIQFQLVKSLWGNASRTYMRGYRIAPNGSFDKNTFDDSATRVAMRPPEHWKRYYAHFRMRVQPGSDLSVYAHSSLDPPVQVGNALLTGVHLTRANSTCRAAF